MTTVVLVSAVLASLAAGVLLAYGICVAMFRVFRMHARQVAALKSNAKLVTAPTPVAKS